MVGGKFVKVAETGSEHDAHEYKSGKPRASSLRTMLQLRDKYSTRRRIPVLVRSKARLENCGAEGCGKNYVVFSSARMLK